jgi:hypothetical protein
MQKVLLIITLIILGFSCHKDDKEYVDLCPGCTSHAKLNGAEWNLDPYLCSLKSISSSGDSLLSFSIFSSVPQDEYFDDLFFSRIPFKVDSIALPDSLGYSGPMLSFNVYEYEYDVARDRYEVVPGSGSYLKVEAINHETHSLKISFNLLLAVNGDTSMSVRNHTYPAILHFTEGEAEMVISK